MAKHEGVGGEGWPLSVHWCHSSSQVQATDQKCNTAYLMCEPTSASMQSWVVQRWMLMMLRCPIMLVVQVVDAPQRLYLVMEWAPSGSLLDYVRARKRLQETDAAYIFQQIVAGLEYCHRREVVHR